MSPTSRLLRPIALLVLMAGVACSSDDSVAGPAGLAGQYKGVAAGGYPNESASFDMAVSAGTVSGTIKLVGAAPVTLTGTYLAATQNVTVSGGGFSLTVSIDNSGEFTGSYAHGQNSGYVAGFQHSATDPVTVFCGSYTGDADGIWNLARRGSALSGAYVNIDGSDGLMSGTITGTSISITDIQDSPGGAYIGTLAGNTMSGTWSGGGYTGTWTSNTTC